MQTVQKKKMGWAKIVTQAKAFKLKKSAIINLPNGIKVEVVIWKDKNRKVRTSVTVKEKNSYVFLCSGNLIMYWNKNKNGGGEIKFEKINIRTNVVGAYFDRVGSQLFKIKRLNKKNLPLGKT